MNKRIFGLDLVRAVAIFLVILVHYFLNNGFYSLIVDGLPMFASMFIRWFAYSCVPLFILLSGYLLKDKEINKKYYKGIFKVILIYFVSTVIISLYLYFIKKADYSIIKYIFNFFEFRYYAWYIEMYIGLFLLVPFLNILYKNIKEKKHKQLLIVILIFLISLSPMFNQVKINNTNLSFMIDYWYMVYPLIYYFIGSYIAEYKIKINKKINIILIFFFLFLETLTTYFYYQGNNFNWTIFEGYGALPTVITSTLIFLLLYDINLKNKIISKMVSSVARVSLSMYLLSYIVDDYFYNNILFKFVNINNGVQSLKYMIPSVIIVFVASYIIAFIVEGSINIVKRHIAFKKNAKTWN